MIPTLSLVFGGTAATAGLPVLGLEPVLGAVTALLAVAAAWIAFGALRNARPKPPRPRSQPLRIVHPVRLAHAGKAC